MKWSIELLKTPDDIELIRSAIAHSGYAIAEATFGSEVSWVLTHPKYREYESAGLVREDVIQLQSRLSEIGAVEDVDLDIKVGDVWKQNTDGSVNKYGFAELVGGVVAGGTMKCGTSSNLDLSEEARARLIAEAQRIENAQKRKAQISRIRLAIDKPIVVQIMKLLKVSSLSMTEAGHIVELIQDDLRGDLSEFATNNEITRFKRSINHPAIMGLGARHAVPKGDPPPKPMTESEARSFARQIGLKWLKSHEQDA